MLGKILAIIITVSPLALSSAAWGLELQVCKAVVDGDQAGEYAVEAYGVGLKFVAANKALMACQNDAEGLGLSGDLCRIEHCEDYEELIL